MNQLPTLHPSVATAAPVAVLYLRVSTEQQTDGTSLDTQRAACLAKAGQIGARVQATYSDEGISGALYASRRGIQAALADIEGGRADTLIAFKLDRTGRDVDVIRAVYRRVEKAGGQVVLAEGANFSGDAQGRLMLTQLAGFAEYEKQIISERTKKGRRSRAEDEGIQVSRSMRPFGYIIPTKADVLTGRYPAETLGRYLQHPAEAPHVRFMFERYAEGDSLRQIAIALQRAGVPTARGGAAWESETLSGIFRNPVHKGEPTFAREERVTDESRQDRGLKTTYYNRARPAEQVVRLSAPAIVSAELWDAANAPPLSRETRERNTPARTIARRKA